MRKGRIIVIAAVLFFALCQKEATREDDHVIKVNGTWISRADVEQTASIIREELMKYSADQAIGGVTDDLLKKAARQLVANQLLVGEAKRRGISFGGAEFDSSFEHFRTQLGDKAAFTRMLSLSGLTEEQFRTQVKDGMTLDSLIKILIEDADSVTEEEARDFYNENEKRFAPRKKVRARQIALLFDTAKASREETIDKADSLRRLAAGGADFEKLAKAHSQGPNARSGGDIGWVSQGDMRPDMERMLFTLEDGQVSSPLKTEQGVLILKKVEEKVPESVTFDEVREEIYSMLEVRKRSEKVSSTVDSLMDKAKIVYADTTLRPEAGGQW